MAFTRRHRGPAIELTFVQNEGTLTLVGKEKFKLAALPANFAPEDPDAIYQFRYELLDAGGNSLYRVVGADPTGVTVEIPAEHREEEDLEEEPPGSRVEDEEGAQEPGREEEEPGEADGDGEETEGFERHLRGTPYRFSILIPDDPNGQRLEIYSADIVTHFRDGKGYDKPVAEVDLGRDPIG